MAAKKIEIDETGRTVALNVTILRATAGLTVSALAERITAAGRPLTRQAVSEIEAGRRRIDVDDLVVLAQVLEVSPATLLMPRSEEPTDVVAVTGTRTMAEWVWRWLTADADVDTDQTEGRIEAFRRRAQPGWERRR